MARPEREEMLRQFTAITHTSASEAETYLEATNWEFELAIDYFLARRAQGSKSNSGYGSQHLSKGKSNGSTSSGGKDSDDDVRPPIAPKKEVLIRDFGVPYGHPPTPYFAPHVRPSMDGQPLPNAAPSSQSVYSRPTTEGGKESKASRLDALFRPPEDLLHVGTLISARQRAESARKWLLVDVYNPNEFFCCVLNRDLWRHPEVRRLIKTWFIFWQVSPTSVEGQNYVNFYHVASYPHVSILDPRTGERLVTWGQQSRLTAKAFCDNVAAFLAKHKDFDQSDAASGGKERKSRPDSSSHHSIDDKSSKLPLEPMMSEEDQLKAAIALSLEQLENQKQQAKKSQDSKRNWTSTKASSLSSSSSSGSTSLSPKSTLPAAISPDAYKAHLGPADGVSFLLLFHLPNGSRVEAKFSSGSKLIALYLYIGAKYPEYSAYTLATNFPKKVIPKSEEITLEQAGLRPRDTIYLQPPK